MKRTEFLQQMLQIDRIRDAAKPPPLHVEHIFGKGFFYEERFPGSCRGERVWSPDNPMRG